jgi:predicted nucleic acid-binding protein
MKRLVSHRPQAIDLWLSATAASAAIAVITLCAKLP